MDTITTEHRALATLRLLERASAYRSNERLIAARLEELGMATLPEQVRDMLDGFERRGFVRVEHSSGVVVVTLTQARQEVACGLRAAEGVPRPRPDESY
jgi:hypothetical protein